MDFSDSENNSGYTKYYYFVVVIFNYSFKEGFFIRYYHRLVFVLVLKKT